MWGELQLHTYHKRIGFKMQLSASAAGRDVHVGGAGNVNGNGKILSGQLKTPLTVS